MNVPVYASHEEVVSPALLAKRPRVSVLCITYNHEPFVAQCIDGVLAQRAPFDIELVIGEDRSTDRTRDICLDYQRRHPETIRLLLARSNAGIGRNLAATYAACRGDYVAIVEGDDYWTEADKLRVQMDAIDRHPRWIGCFHNVTIQCEDCGHSHGPYHPAAPAEALSQTDLLVEDSVPTCSVVFRNRLSAAFPPWFEGCPCRDWAWHVLNTEHGLMGYVHRLMGVYRIHQGGVWGSVCGATAEKDIRRMEARLTMYRHFRRHFGSRYVSLIRREVGRTAFHLAVAYRREAEWPRFWRSALRSVWAAPAASGAVWRIMAVALSPTRRRHYERAAAERRRHEAQQKAAPCASPGRVSA